MKTGLRPLISLSGASTIGATPNPVVKVVIPTLNATSLTPHSFVHCAVAEAYDPAEYAATTVDMHESHTIKVFRVSDHSNGEVKGRRSGGSGAGGPPSDLDSAIPVGEGNYVSNSRYL